MQVPGRLYPPAAPPFPASTGPGTNSPGPYTYSETSSGTVTTIEEASRAVLNVVSMWPQATGRTLRLQASIMGDWDTDGEGMVVQTQPTGGTWTDVRVVNGWLYGNTYAAGDTITPYQSGGAFTCARNGGWGNFDFDHPGRRDRRADSEPPDIRLAISTRYGALERTFEERLMVEDNTSFRRTHQWTRD